VTTVDDQTCVIIALNRPKARGGVKRIETWRDNATALGYKVTVVYVNRTREDLRPRRLLQTVAAIARGQRLVEALAASPTEIERSMDRSADLTIVVTLRCVTDAVVSSSNDVVIDVVDDLARNYRGRAREARWPMRFVFMVLAPLTRRAQNKMIRSLDNQSRVHVCAAGFADAQSLGVSWQPIPVIALPAPTPLIQRKYDIGFVGTMTYAPNARAVRAVCAIHAELASRGLHPTFVVAGSGIDDAMRLDLESRNITVIVDPPDMSVVLGQIRIFVAPLNTATGIQIKLLEAGAAGCAVVATAATLSGFDYAHQVAPTPTNQFADQLARLLGDPAACAANAEAWSDYVVKNFSPEATQQNLLALLGG